MSESGNNGKENLFPSLKHSRNGLDVWKNGKGFDQPGEWLNSSFQTIGETPGGAKGLTSYFFTNIPDDFGEEAMWGVFKHWGKVWDIYIPPRRDKNGKRFGFVKFKDVLNAKALEESLKMVQIGDKKVTVNLPRYGRNAIRRPNVVQRKQFSYMPRRNNIRSGVSYSQVVREGDFVDNRQKIYDCTGQGRGRVNGGRNKEWKGMSFNIEEEEMSWLQGSFVG